jgi:hypothetical protein
VNGEAMFREHVEAIRLFRAANAPLPEGRKSTFAPGELYRCARAAVQMKLTPEQPAELERFLEGCLTRAREHIAALRNMRNLPSVDSDPVALLDKEAKVARIKRARQQLRVLREIEEGRKQRADLGAAELQGGDSSGEIGFGHSAESAKPAGRNQLAEGKK